MAAPRAPTPKPAHVRCKYAAGFASPVHIRCGVGEAPNSKSIKRVRAPGGFAFSKVMRSSRVGGDPETESALPAEDGAEQLDAALTRLKVR